MTNKFTFLLTALLALFAIPGWGQSGETYTVTIDDDIRFGTITIAENEFAAGDTVSLNAEPGVRCYLESISITRTSDGTETGIVPVYDSVSEKHNFLMPDYDITVSATFVGNMQTFTRLNSMNDFLTGFMYIIVGEDNGTYYSMGEAAGNSRPAMQIEADAATAFQTYTTDRFYIGGDPTNLYTFCDRLHFSTQGFLCAGNGESDQLLLQSDLTDNGKWIISIDETTGEASIVAQGDCARNTLRFDPDTKQFSCYAAENNMNPVYIYMLNAEGDIKDYSFYSNTLIDGDVYSDGYYTVSGNAILTITGNFTVDPNLTYTPYSICIEDNSQLVTNCDVPNAMYTRRMANHNGGASDEITAWNLLATPYKEYGPLVPFLLFSSSYRVFVYDEPSYGWTEMQTEPLFQMAHGLGYMVGFPGNNSEATVVGMNGTFPSSREDLSFDLNYTETAGEYKGFNMVGNPFPCNAYANMDYLVLNETGNNFIVGTTLRPCDGLMVQATAANQQVTFSRNAPETPDGFIELGIAQGENPLFDNARIFFNEGHRMNKFYLNENSTCIYIPQNGEQLAIANTQPQGEMPVNFKAAEDGTYTLTVNTEKATAEYLHLIDSQAGTDIDLLAAALAGSASYTFDAMANDNAARFRLVFSITGIEENAASASSTSFAYMSNGNLVIDNVEGIATLQIFDMLGRMVSSETVEGNYNKALNLKSGVYVLNLNGMTQKLVVE